MNTLDPHGRSLILLVDDVPTNLHVMTGLLREHYATRVATGGHRALELARMIPQPDLILLDVMMPDLDGYEVCRQLRSRPETADIPVIFLTTRTSPEDEERGFAAGAVDYIHKPISPPIALARVRTHLSLKRAHDAIEDRAAWLESQVRRRTAEIEETRDAMIIALGSLTETRDNETGNHIRRTQGYLRLLCEHARQEERWAQELTPRVTRLIVQNAPLHDIGKVGIPDRILLKPGALTAEEFEIMKTHTTLGWEALRSAAARIESDKASVHLAMNMVRSHHERWDGTGYPDGLAGEAIPIEARLMAIADVYDALVSWRIYKQPIPHEESVAILRAGRGTQFDPELLDVFLAHHEAFGAIHDSLADTAETVHNTLRRFHPEPSQLPTPPVSPS